MNFLCPDKKHIPVGCYVPRFDDETAKIVRFANLDRRSIPSHQNTPKVVFDHVLKHLQWIYGLRAGAVTPRERRHAPQTRLIMTLA